MHMHVGIFSIVLYVHFLFQKWRPVTVIIIHCSRFMRLVNCMHADKSDYHAICIQPSYLLTDKSTSYLQADNQSVIRQQITRSVIG